VLIDDAILDRVRLWVVGGVGQNEGTFATMVNRTAADVSHLIVRAVIWEVLLLQFVVTGRALGFITGDESCTF